MNAKTAIIQANKMPKEMLPRIAKLMIKNYWGIIALPAEDGISASHADVLEGAFSSYVSHNRFLFQAQAFRDTLEL
ncbi:MAG: hypothetical protein K6F46_04280, partial [Desulfovibrio sp.]|nr:hypothetical protein [Desulfovibrio sp.]